MKLPPVTLVLTADAQLEDALAQALFQIGGVSHLAQTPDEALRIICGSGHDLDLAVIDFEHGPHGMTLLGAIQMCREDFPVIVITNADEKHAEALAYANGAVACLHKPATGCQLMAAINEFCHPRYELALVAETT